MSCSHKIVHSIEAYLHGSVRLATEKECQPTSKEECECTNWDSTEVASRVHLCTAKRRGSDQEASERGTTEPQETTASSPVGSN